MLTEVKNSKLARKPGTRYTKPRNYNHPERFCFTAQKNENFMSLARWKILTCFQGLYMRREKDLLSPRTFQKNLANFSPGGAWVSLVWGKRMWVKLANPNTWQFIMTFYWSYGMKFKAITYTQHHTSKMIMLRINKAVITTYLFSELKHFSATSDSLTFL